jgi:hypothetical protein
VGRTKVVAGSGRAEEGGRQADRRRKADRWAETCRQIGKGLWTGKKRQADRGNVAERSMQPSRDRSRQTRDTGRQRGR